MTVARGPILTPGFYWIDSFHRAGKPTFNAWLERSKGIVAVRNTSLHVDEDPPRDWILFEVLHPALWAPQDATDFGFPTVAPHGAKTVEEDSRDAPEPTPGGNIIEDFLKGLQAGGVGGLLLLAGIVYAVGSSGGRDRSRRL